MSSSKDKCLAKEEEEEEELDPRVQVELEVLNVCTDEINRLEVQLDESNAHFRSALTECTQRLNYLIEKLGKCIEKAKVYYDAIEVSKKEQIECQKAAVKFQRAVSVYSAAKERIALAERRFQNNGRNEDEDCQFDVIWQDMLNHDMEKLVLAESQRSESEKEHRLRAQLFAKAEKNVLYLEQKLRSAIIKSKPYYEYKALFQNELKLLKEKIVSLQNGVVGAKERYAQALRNLETISEEIHEKRNLKCPREPGVGAEMTELCDSSKELSSFLEVGCKSDRLKLENGFDFNADNKTIVDSELDESTLCASSLSLESRLEALNLCGQTSDRDSSDSFSSGTNRIVEHSSEASC